MSEAGAEPVALIMKIIMLHFIAPAIIAVSIHMIMKKRGWVKPGDMKL
jgi:uncharacterized membrane protein